MPLKVTQNKLDSGVEVLTLAGSLTLGRDAQNFEWTVEELIKNQARRIVIDLTEVSFVDSAGIGILVGCHGKVASAGGQLHHRGQVEVISSIERDGRPRAELLGHDHPRRQIGRAHV